MQYGVVYHFVPHNKINGTLFYCFEYCQMLRQCVDAQLYIVGITPNDLALVHAILSAKYCVPITNIVPVRRSIDLYQLKLDKTLILDINTFTKTKEFLTNEIVCFSNIRHPMFRYKNDRIVTYFGSYAYQDYD